MRRRMVSTNDSMSLAVCFRLRLAVRVATLSRTKKDENALKFPTLPSVLTSLLRSHLSSVLPFFRGTLVLCQISLRPGPVIGCLSHGPSRLAKRKKKEIMARLSITAMTDCGHNRDCTSIHPLLP